MTKTKQSRASADRNTESNSSHSKGVLKTKRTRKSVPRESPSQRSSVYRGVTRFSNSDPICFFAVLYLLHCHPISSCSVPTIGLDSFTPLCFPRHRWTGRYEAHLWDKNSWNETQNKKGRQVYLGAYDDEEAAARAYDLAALKYWGQDTMLNFPLSTYHEELKGMEAQSKEEYIGSLRRKSSGFSRGVSKYRGVARHHHNGRWEARIGRVLGNKYLYLGTYATQEEAATAYDIAAIEYRGLNAVTNFDLSRYIKWLRPNHEGRTPVMNPQPTSSGVDDVQPSPQFRQQQRLGGGDTADVSVADGDGNKAVATSALGIFLQSTKFKEMLGRTATSEVSSAGMKQPPRCSFPEDIQTYFECHDNGGFVEGDGTLFGELNAFETPIFQCQLDV